MWIVKVQSIRVAPPQRRDPKRDEEKNLKNGESKCRSSQEVSNQLLFLYFVLDFQKQIVSLEKKSYSRSIYDKTSISKRRRKEIIKTNECELMKSDTVLNLKLQCSSSK